jgi:hypothetical protein
MHSDEISPPYCSHLSLICEAYKVLRLANHRLSGSTAFAVELPSRLSKKAARLYSTAVRRLLA